MRRALWLTLLASACSFEAVTTRLPSAFLIVSDLAATSALGLRVSVVWEPEPPSTAS